jgi:hypothetical protein
MAAEYLPLSENTITMLVRVTEKGIEIGASKDVERLLFGKSFPKGGWSGKTGEPPPALVKIKNTFEKMREIAKSGELRIIIGKCIEILDSEIKDDLRRDEEFLTPRG